MNGSDAQDAGQVRRTQEEEPGSRDSRGSGVHVYPLQFGASGSEYFRIWIVNLLLIAVTLGIYMPWAKVRKLRYFYSNTSVDGDALDFHGSPARMLRGTMIVGVFFVVYSAAANASGIAGLVSAIAFATIWPLLFRASMRFRLANTSWRGLRFSFTGDVAGAYGAILPGLLLTVVPIALGDAFGEPGPRGRIVMPPGIGATIGAALLIFVVLLPFFFFRLKRYQHGHYALGSLVTELRSSPGPFYMLALKTFGILLLGLAIIGGVAVASFTLGRSSPGFAMLSALAMGLGGVLFFNIVPKAFVVSRLQNLVWSRTGNRWLRFRSTLDFNSYAMLQFKNFLLIIVTLGFYWPFAVIANMRARIEAVQLHTRMPLAELTGDAAAGQNDATGDAAADLFGLDVGL